MNEFDTLKGLRHSEQLVVEHKDTAAVYGSGALEVFATPAMIALMEKTCLMGVCDKIGEGNTTVGIAVNIKHLKASPVGSTIRCEAELVEVDRRRLVFEVKCYEGTSLVGEGVHERFVVESEKFMSKFPQTVQKPSFCQSCGMPLTDQVLGTNADGSKNEDYCMYCYKDGKFLQDCTMDEMIEHCAQFVDEVNKGLPQPITKEEYIGQMKMYFPHLKRWRESMKVTDDAMPENPALAGVKTLIAEMADNLPITYISSVDEEGFPCTKAMLSPRVREGIKVFYFTTNTFSLRVAHYKANPKACIYFSDNEGFKGMMLRGTMEVLTDAKSKEMIWREGDEQYYPGGVTDPNYCVLKFTATDGRFYSDFYPRNFVL